MRNDYIILLFLIISSPSVLFSQELPVDSAQTQQDTTAKLVEEVIGRLSDEEVNRAILMGQEDRIKDLIFTGQAEAGFGDTFSQTFGAGIGGGFSQAGGFDVNVTTSFGRIAFRASDAKRLYKSYSIDDVPEEIRISCLWVFIDPQKPDLSGKTPEVSAPIDHVILKSKKNSNLVVQPESIETELVEWSNLMGGNIQGNKATAAFSIDAVKNLPPGDIEVIVITQAGERKCKIKEKERRRLFEAKE